MHFTLYTADCRENARNIRYPNPAAITSAADLKKATAYDHVCAQYADGIRKEANFQFSDVLPMDCDNDHSDNPNDWLTPERLAQQLPDVAFAATYSRHHMQAKGKYSARPRFHVFFPTAACTNAATHKAMKLRIQKALPFFDGNALDAARFLFGASGEVFWQEGSLHIENWLLLQTARRNIPQGQRNSTMSRLAGKLVKRYGVTEEAHTKFLEQSAACIPPLSDTELQQIWKSAERFGRRLAEQPDYIAPAAFSTQPQTLPALLPEDFSDLGEARTFVEQYADEIAFTVATDYLRYNGTYWEESEHAVTLAMMEHTDHQLAEAEKQVEAALQTLEHLGIPREAAKTGGKKFRDSLDEAQTAAYQQYQYYNAFQAFVMKYRNVRSMVNALEAAKSLVLHSPDELDRNPMLLNNVINLKRLLNGKQNVWKYQNGEEKSDSDGREKDV